ncbi:hypothetical protein D2E26_0510 [Bifidobacterium dolichotidis]|uniref:Transporter n=1 Tax=Bifidobacterium dolichotidis TaxID=2306976 RepID=A0A430FT01_9BIFI|nr:hypothetical protein [Bifidobacterium dolichotidis]RSX55947.1 hypothetical protein D2E26_0510 [Bifidobacterium dolichotidis]
MFKRLLWIGLGIITGVMIVSKAQAFVKANTPDKARQFVLGPDQDHVGMRTLESLVAEFKTAQRTREAQLNKQYSGIID